MTAPATPGTDPAAQLRLQKAIVMAHRQGQRLYALRLGVVVVVTGLGVLGALLGGVESAATWATAGGLVAAGLPLVLSWLFGRWESAATDRAAILQHTFDSQVFGFPDVPFVPAVDAADLDRLAAVWSGDEAVLRDWYPDTGRLSGWPAAMVLQRLNLRWDVDHRRRLAWCALAAGAVVLAAGAGVARLAGWGPAQLLVGWVGPTAAVSQLALEAWFRHRGLAADKARLADEATALLTGTDVTRPDEDDCLVLQLAILALRRRAPRVPGWLQAWDHDRLWSTAVADIASIEQEPRYAP